MKSVYFLAIAALGAVAFACGTDTNSTPGQTNVPTNSVCPKQLHVMALASESLAPKGIADMTIALTFDSGPSDATASIEAYLAQQRIRATFFVMGSSVSGLESTLSQTASDGHLLANRGNTDDDMTTLQPADVVQSVTTTDALIASLVPDGKFFFRPPYGGWNDATQSALTGSPMSKYTGPVGWDIGDNLDATTGSDSDCFAPDTGAAKTPQQCGDLFMAQITAKKKGVVLMHDGPADTEAPSQTFAMLQYMIPLLQNQGYKFARVDELTLVPESQLVAGADTSTDGGVVDDTPDPCKF